MTTKLVVAVFTALAVLQAALDLTRPAITAPGEIALPVDGPH